MLLKKRFPSAHTCLVASALMFLILPIACTKVPHAERLAALDEEYEDWLESLVGIAAYDAWNEGESTTIDVGGAARKWRRMTRREALQTNPALSELVPSLDRSLLSWLDETPAPYPPPPPSEESCDKKSSLVRAVCRSEAVAWSLTRTHAVANAIDAGEITDAEHAVAVNWAREEMERKGVKGANELEFAEWIAEGYEVTGALDVNATTWELKYKTASQLLNPNAQSNMLEDYELLLEINTESLLLELREWAQIAN